MHIECGRRVLLTTWTETMRMITKVKITLFSGGHTFVPE